MTRVGPDIKSNKKTISHFFVGHERVSLSGLLLPGEYFFIGLSRTAPKKNFATIGVTESFKNFHHRDVVEVRICLYTVNFVDKRNVFNEFEHFFRKTAAKVTFRNGHAMHDDKLTVCEPLPLDVFIGRLIVKNHCTITDDGVVMGQDVADALLNVLPNNFWVGVTVLPLVTTLVFSATYGVLQDEPYLVRLVERCLSEIILHNIRKWANL